MIRAVPIEYFIDDESPSHLAFLSTVDDCFIKFDGVHVWDSWDDFATDCDDDEFLQRVKPLCPRWFFNVPVWGK